MRGSPWWDVRTSPPHFQVAIGFSTNESSLFLGDGDESVGFDSEGAYIRRDTSLRMKSKFS